MPFTHEHSSVPGPFFQQSFGSDDNVVNLYVLNNDLALNPFDKIVVFYVNDNNLADCPK
jgi:hypothetical protein